MSGRGDRELEETRLDGRLVHDGRVVRLEVDRVRLPGGAETVREVVRHPGAAVVVPVDGERVTLVRQWRYPTGGPLLELPAGKLDPGEEPERCARRELEEETGLVASRLVRLGGFYTAPGFTDEWVEAFLALGVGPSPQGRRDVDEERIELVEMPVADAIRAAGDGTVRDAKSIAALLLAGHRLSGPTGAAPPR